MTLTNDDLRARLCWLDPRSPDYGSHSHKYGCAGCLNGTHPLADELLRLREARAAIAAFIKTQSRLPADIEKIVAENWQEYWDAGLAAHPAAEAAPYSGYGVAKGFDRTAPPVVQPDRHGKVTSKAEGVPERKPFWQFVEAKRPEGEAEYRWRDPRGMVVVTKTPSPPPVPESEP